MERLLLMFSQSSLGLVVLIQHIIGIFMRIRRDKFVKSDLLTGL